MVKPARRRDLVGFFRKRFQMSTSRACELASLARSTYRYQPRRQEHQALRQRLIELAVERPRFGYRRLHLLLRREGFQANHKKVYRLYREEGLAVRRRRRKRVARSRRRPLATPSCINERWSMDVVGDEKARHSGYLTAV